MKVAIVHDDLVQWGGAERVLIAVSEIFPEAPIYTSVFDNHNPILSRNFGGKKIITSFMQSIPGWRTFYKALLPIYPVAFEQFDLTGYDLVLSHTTRFAKSVITKPETRHVCYCHTPPRFLWNFSNENASRLLLPYFSPLRIYDRVSSARVDTWLAGSKNCRERIGKVYRRDAEILYPFVDDKFFMPEISFDGSYYLMVCRLNGYKGVELAVRVLSELGVPLKIVGVGPQYAELARDAAGNIEFLGFVQDDVLVRLFSGSRAVICMAEEDFGLTAVEAQAMGKPVIAYAAGGVLETVVPGKTGVFFYEKNAVSLKKAVEEAGDRQFDPRDCVASARRFSKAQFKNRLINFLQ